MQLVPGNIENSRCLAALDASEKRYRWLLDVSSEAILLHRHGRLDLANEAAAALFCAEAPDQLVGKRVRELIVESNDDRPGADGDEGFIGCKLKRLDGTVVDGMFIENSCSFEGKPAAQMVIRDVSERRQIVADSDDPVQFDPLTKLPNRHQFSERLLTAAISRGIRQKQPIALLILDLDYFKAVNKARGHRAGDLVLVQVADRLRQCARRGDTVASLGGNEFAMILEGLTGEEGAVIAAQRVLRTLSQPILVEGQEISITASIGIVAAALDALGVDKLLHDADVAMCYAKDHGRNMYEFYTPELEERHTRNELRRADIDRKLAELTPREREVLDMVVAGKANKMIAYLLGTSARTIENHRASIMDKMQADSLPELVRMVVERRRT